MASTSMTGTSAVTIRPYHPRDLTALMALFRASVHGTARRDYSARQLAAWAPRDLDQEAWERRLEANHTLAAEEDAMIVGFAELAPGGHVDMLFVVPDRQRRGIARALLRALETEAARRGEQRLTTDASRTARPFFLAAGFRPVEAREVERRGVRIENFRMEKDL
jgi:GNAT superfamily N-acetyltransferase